MTKCLLHTMHIPDTSNSTACASRCSPVLCCSRRLRSFCAAVFPVCCCQLHSHRLPVHNHSLNCSRRLRSFCASHFPVRCFQLHSHGLPVRDDALRRRLRCCSRRLRCLLRRLLLQGCCVLDGGRCLRNALANLQEWARERMCATVSVDLKCHAMPCHATTGATLCKMSTADKLRVWYVCASHKPSVKTLPMLSCRAPSRPAHV